MLFQKSQQERKIDAPNEFQIFLKEEKLAQYNYSKPIVQYFQKLWKGSRKKKKKKLILPPQWLKSEQEQIGSVCKLRRQKRVRDKSNEREKQREMQDMS